MSEHDFEPIRGLPGPLPEGETILWQGAPNWLVLAGQAFHVRAVAAYLVGMLVWRTSSAIIEGQAPSTAIQSALSVTPIGLAALGMLAFLAWLNARTTVYTITNRRVVMRFGAALPKAINFPFQIIDSAALKPFADGSGDLALALKAPNKIAFLLLWPHVRPWRVAAPQPHSARHTERGSRGRDSRCGHGAHCDDRDVPRRSDGQSAQGRSVGSRTSRGCAGVTRNES